MSPRSLRRRSSAEGFTLIELMVVIAIIVLAAGMMTPTITDFFKNRQLESVRGQLGSAFNRARLKAVTEGIQASLVFFREGPRVFDERKKKFVDDLFNPDNTALAKGTVWYLFGFLGGMPSTQLPKYREWEAAQIRVRKAMEEQGSTLSGVTGETFNVEVPKLPRIVFERDGSLTFATGADVGSNYFKEEPVPSNADIIIHQANNTTSCFIDLRPAGQFKSNMVPTGVIQKRPGENDEESS